MGKISIYMYLDMNVDQEQQQMKPTVNEMTDVVLQPKVNLYQQQVGLCVVEYNIYTKRVLVQENKKLAEGDLV